MKRLLMILGVVSLSLSSIMVRLSTAPSTVLVVYRVFFALALLTPSLFLRHRAELVALPRQGWLLCLASGFFLGLHFAIGFESYRTTSIAAATVLINTEVFFVAMGSVLFLRQRLNGKAWLAILWTFLGSIVVALAGTAQGSTLWGNLLAVLAALFMTGYTVIGTVCRRTMTTTVYTFLVYFFAEVTVLAIVLLGGTPLFGYGSVNFLTALVMAVFCNLLGHSVFSWGLKYLPPTFISTVKLLGGTAVLLGIALYCRITGGREDALREIERSGVDR